MNETDHVSHECIYCGEDHPESAHGEPVAVREGATLRTADDLAVTFLEDVAELYAYTFPDRASTDRLKVEDAANYWRAQLPKGGWLPVDDEGASPDALQDAVFQGEQRLADAGYFVEWDDGYVIVRDAEDGPAAD